MTTSYSNYVENWSNIPWNQFEQILLRLQYRIYKATKRKDYNQVRKLQSLLIGSSSSRYLAVKSMSQSSIIKNIIEKNSNQELSAEYKLALVEKLKKITQWKHMKFNRITISNYKNKYSYVFVPQIQDLAIHYLITYALEPVLLASGVSNSDLQNTPHAKWNIQKTICNNLKKSSKGFEKYLLRVNLQEYYRKINTKILLPMLILPNSLKRIIKSALRKDILNFNNISKYNINMTVLTTLICNIFWHGIEDIGYTITTSPGLRYFDQLILFFNSPLEYYELSNRIHYFFHKRELKIQNKDIRVIKPTDGFDFIDWHFRIHYKTHKLVNYPSKENYRKMVNLIKKVMRNSRYPLEERLGQVKIIYQGWYSYHKFCNLKYINLWNIQNWTYRFAKKLNTKKNKLSRAVGKKKIREQMYDIFKRIE